MTVFWGTAKHGLIFDCLEWNYDAFKLRFLIFSGKKWNKVLSKWGLIEVFRKYR